ncbi:Dbl homology domain-containing protein [Phycomyces nitens]|nr:Dbl homology domain-containing protein [Phycomyces nitens]
MSSFSRYSNDDTTDRRQPVFRRLHKAYKSLLTNFSVKKSSSTPLNPTTSTSTSTSTYTSTTPKVQLSHVQPIPSTLAPQKPAHNPIFSHSAVEPPTVVPLYTQRARPFSQFIGLSRMNQDTKDEDEIEDDEEDPNEPDIIVTFPVDVVSTASSSSASSLQTEYCVEPQLDSAQSTFNDINPIDTYSLQFTVMPIKDLEFPKTFASRIDFPILPLRTRSAALRKADVQQQKALMVWKDSIFELQQKRYSQGLISDIHQQKLALSETKKTALVNFILHEIVTTEQSYNQLLSLIETRYMSQMVDASKEKVSLVKSTDIPVLFGHLPVLLSLSNQILEAFRAQSTSKWQPWSVPVGQIFCSISQFLVIFLQYAIHYRTHTRIIQKACNNTLFMKIDQDTLRRRDTNRLGMSDFLIAPIQRVPRYCMLLKDLLKYTDKSDKDYEPLSRALCTLTGLVMAMNHSHTL